MRKTNFCSTHPRNIYKQRWTFDYINKLNRTKSHLQTHYNTCLHLGIESCIDFIDSWYAKKNNLVARKVSITNSKSLSEEDDLSIISEKTNTLEEYIFENSTKSTNNTEEDDLSINSKKTNTLEEYIFENSTKSINNTKEDDSSVNCKKTNTLEKYIFKNSTKSINNTSPKIPSSKSKESNFSVILEKSSKFQTLVDISTILINNEHPLKKKV